jgi:hypothetical protein
MTMKLLKSKFMKNYGIKTWMIEKQVPEIVIVGT